MFLRCLVLIITLLLPAIVFATPEPGTFIKNSPGSKRPIIPKLLPKKQAPIFELPAIPDEHENQATTGARIKLNAVRFTGNTVIKDTELQAIAKTFIGHSIRTSELEELRQRITKLYISQGYVNSGALLVSQKFEQGIIEYKIVEGTLDDTEIVGSDWLSESYLRDRLQSAGGLFNPDGGLFSNSTVFNVNTLRERFQLLLTDPLIKQMEGQLLPGTTPGKSKLLINVKRARPYQLSISYDNARPPSVGADQGQLSGYVRNLTGFGDLIDVTLSLSDGTGEANTGFSIPLNSYNTIFSFRFDFSETSVIEEPLDAIDIESRYTSFDFGLTQSLYKTLTKNLDTGISLSIRKNRTTLLGQPFDFTRGSENGESKTSVLRMHLGFSDRIETQVFSAKATANIGIDAFDSTQHTDRDRPDSDFLVWLGQLQYARQIRDDGTLLFLRGDVQYANDKLLPLERFSLGGRHSVRGYRENEVVRDNGYILSAELRYPVHSLLHDYAYQEYIGQIHLVPFMDYGAGWNRGESGQKRYLHSIGIGLQWQPISRIKSEIYYAHDLNAADEKADYNLQDSGLHFRVSVSAF